jgi:hypothetical protein
VCILRLDATCWVVANASGSLGSGFEPTIAEMLVLMYCIVGHRSIWDTILQAYGVFGMGGIFALIVWSVTLVLPIATAVMLLWYRSRRTQVVPGTLKCLLSMCTAKWCRCR